VNERITDRSSLIEYVARHAPAPAVRRACVTGQVEVLGAFSDPYRWMLRVVACHGTEYVVAVIPSEVAHTYVVAVGGLVSWEQWLGGTPPLYRGDHPTRYARWRQFNATAQSVFDRA
jgi:hypothetical protein